MNQNKLKIIETIDKMQNELLTLSHQMIIRNWDSRNIRL
jgi:hypothetical protein